ncbi:MAG: flagellin [Campylobacterota bacterium]|nr:flagellin [Campylobacterota bacterium]
MGFRINTNIAAMNAHTNATMNNRNLDNSLAKLSSGLRINTAADDSSGMVIADNLRSQANSLGQAIANANDGISIIQTADKAMDEQLKILDTIKTKAIQASSDTQNAQSRQAIQKDVDQLLAALDNIAKTTSFNGQSLLSGNFTGKEFQIGAYSNQTVGASIDNTQSLAIGNITSKSDISAVGNTVSDAVTVEMTKGTKTFAMSSAVGAGLSAAGLAQGDTIRIDGVGDYTIENVSGVISTGGLSGATITLDRGLDKTISVGGDFKISIVQTVAEDLSGIVATGQVADAASEATLSVADISGFALGDKINITNSAGVTKEYTVAGVVGTAIGSASGAITISTTATTSGGAITAATAISMSDRSSLGTDYTGSDYVQYTVDGTQLQGVQLTNAVTVTKSDASTATQAAGVDQSGLGRVADLINSTSDKTGIKAVAVVEQNSNIRVAAGAITSDIFINGERILDSGTSLLSADSDNTLINAINQKTNLTGVSATLEADGTMTLTSDGRAMVTDGLSAVAGINDGVHAGELQFTNLAGGNIDVSSKHFSDAGLVTANGSAATLNEVEQSSVLSDLRYGQVDDNGDGKIDSSDQVGLMLTQEGAMKSMNIVESAISKLDATRADLGSVQNQLTVTVNNISVTQVNVKAAESQIRDVDFAAESAEFSKFNILAQSGSYAMSQANAIQQNVLRLLQ